MAEDFREKMIINARKNVPLQHVPYFDVQNTDERPSFVKHFDTGFSLNNFFCTNTTLFSSVYDFANNFGYLCILIQLH